jgi:corrinoid protein of di/trimethylamine methyltransferase
MENLFNALKSAVEKYEPEKAKQVAKEIVNAQIDPLKAIDEVLVPTMEQIGEKFDKMEIFLPELVVAAEAMQAATSILMEPLKSTEIPKTKGKVVLGTVYGDVHDIGKNIVKVMMEVSGFEVFDLGNKVPSMQFIEKAEEVNADIIALSALMATTMGSQKEVIELLEALGKRDDYIVIIGGAPTTTAWQEEIGADGWAETAAGAAKIAAKWMKEKGK